MAALRAMESWMDDDIGRMAGRESSDAALLKSAGRPNTGAEAGAGTRTFSTDQFETEAMPHLNDLFRTATRILGERGKAEDVVQEVYLQAWKSFHRFEPGTNCRAWLFRILFHCVNHHRRKWFRFPLLRQTEEFIEANLVYTPPVPKQLTDKEILNALDEIPSDFKPVVLLVDVEEFSYKEVSEILGIPIGTVMSRLSRGRRQLREHLTQVAKSYGIGVAAGEGKRA
jgi:RNA polymerase sigma-70 factor (ECF subfamily)